MEPFIAKDKQLCMSLSDRRGNFGTIIHNFLYRELRLNFIFKAFTTSNLATAISEIHALGIRGCALSMPFKEACIEYHDELDASAKEIMSANTLVSTDRYFANLVVV
jgi:shikimate dehydrogenase